MPRCSYCGCDLPGLTDVCRKCFEARYAEIDNPKSFLEILTNPAGLTADELREVKETPVPLGRTIRIFLSAFAFMFVYVLLRSRFSHFVDGLWGGHFKYHPFTPTTSALIALLFALIVVYVESRSRR
jgi:hypothetical protein